MSKFLSFSLTICCLTLFQYVYGEISFGDEDESVGFIDFDSSFSSESGSDSSESSSSEEKEDKIERRTHKRHRRPIHLDICKCQDERCTCCFKFLKNQICDNFQLVNVSSDSKSLGVEFNVTVNDKSVYSDELSFERLPTVCYRKANIGICGKLTAKEIKSDDEKKVEFCGDLQLKFNSEVIAHFNVFCVKVGKKSEQTEDENVLNDDGAFTFWPKI